MALRRYLREELLGKELKPRRSHSKTPIEGHEALGRALETLGR
ncbi:MAG: hypothetical protein AAF709_12785 [Pseudomonadota bacterium]